MGMGDKDQIQEPPICRVCLGAGGEWMELNGVEDRHREWVKCKACKGTGRAA